MQSEPHRASHSQPVPRASGFTLIELLVVIGIIAILMGIAIAVGAKVQGSGKVKATKDMIIALEQVHQAAISANKGEFLPAVVADPRLSTNRSDPKGVLWLAVVDGRAKLNGVVQDPMVNSVALFLWQARQFPEAAKLIEALPSKQMKLLDPDAPDDPLPPGNLPNPDDLKDQPQLATAMDAWGNPIRYVHPAWDGTIFDDPTSNPRSPTEFTQAATVVALPPPPASDPSVERRYLFVEIRRNARKTDSGGGPADGADSDGGTCPDGRPYFYSAGPDGDPATTEDNVYVTVPTFPVKK